MSESSQIRVPPPLKPKPGSVKVSRALYSYSANNENELSVDEGDLLYILDRTHPTLWKARSSNKVGLIPRDCVESQEIREPLHDAARRGNLAFLEECLNQGVSSTGLDTVGNTPLHWAAHCGHLDCLECLLKQPNPPVNVKNNMGDTALHAAAGKNQYKAAEMLLKKGSDSTLKNHNGEMPVELAQDLSVKNLLQSHKPNRISVPSTFSPEEYEDDDDDDENEND